MENIKQKSVEDKIALLKDYMDGKNTDTILALNVYSLFIPNKTFSDDYFSNEKIIFKDIEEFLDIKISIKNQLDDFVSKLLGIYLACVKHCSVLFNPDNKEIEQQYFKILCMLDITTLSNLLDKRKPSDDDSYYREAFGLMKQYSEQFCLYSSLIENQYGDVA